MHSTSSNDYGNHCWQPWMVKTLQLTWPVCCHITGTTAPNKTCTSIVPLPICTASLTEQLKTW